MKIPLHITHAIGYNVWQRYKGKRTGDKALIDLQLVAAQGARDALANELGVPVDDIKIEWSK